MSSPVPACSSPTPFAGGAGSARSGSFTPKCSFSASARRNSGARCPYTSILFTGEEPDNLRGPNNHFGAVDELAAMPYAEEVSLARAVALFTHAPPDVARRLNLPPPQASIQHEPAAVNVPVETKAFEARFAALTERAEAAEKIQGELLAITGKATAGEALALVAGLKEKAAKADELAELLAKFEAEKRAGQIAALLDTASREGRLTPAKREELMKVDAPAFARDPTQLKVFLDCLQPVVVSVAAPKHAEPKENPEASLTEDEKHFAEQLKVDPKKIAEFKRDKR